jgi:hypothetical protein
MMIFDEMADLLERGANVYLEGTGIEPVRRFPISQSALDEQVFLKSLKTEQPSQWINQIVSTYLYECAHELLAIATLLRFRRIAAVAELIVRAMIKRVGRIGWILEEGAPAEIEATNAGKDFVDVRRRGIRASFELLVPLQHYRTGLDTIRAPRESRNNARDSLRSARELITEKWFKTIKPLSDPCDPDSPSSPTISEWIIGGEKYPKYEALARWALASGSLSNAASRGTYAALSGWSHPNFVAAAEHFNDEQTAYTYDADYLQRLFSLALFGFMTAFKYWLGYCDHNHDYIVANLDAIAADWERMAESLAMVESDRESPQN